MSAWFKDSTSGMFRDELHVVRIQTTALGRQGCYNNLLVGKQASLPVLNEP